MTSCACDFDAPTFYRKREPRARTPHRCGECGGAIAPGEVYEYASGMWDGDFSVQKTCPRCLDLRKWVQAHVPCFCWYHGNVREDALETARAYAHEGPGLLFGAYRREVAIRRARRP